MAEVVSNQNYALESSAFLTRPDLKVFLRTDTNAGKTDVTSYVDETNFRRLGVPRSTGTPDYEVTCCDNKVNNNVPLPSRTKKRVEQNIIDPLSGFISPSGEVSINSGINGLSSFGNSRLEPQTIIPQTIHSVRPREESINEIKRESQYDQHPELKWNSQKVSDNVLRARLGGWTSAKDTRQDTRKIQINTNPYRLKDIYPNMKLCYDNEAERDELAKNYMYRTSTQEMYQQVNWDSKLPNKLHAPITTYENGVADPLKRSDQVDHRPQIWQTSMGATWDRLQARNTYFARQSVAYTAPTRRGNQIPGYAGHIGGKNLENMDDVIENFEPFTVLRTNQPKETEPNNKTNIPGYTGHTHNFKISSVSHYDREGRPYTTTAAFHRQLPHVNQNHPDIPSLSGDFSRIQTKVAPNNPYDNIDRTVDPDINKSLDNLVHPTITPKKSNNEDYLVKNREKELRSILKKRTEVEQRK